MPIGGSSQLVPGVSRSLCIEHVQKGSQQEAESFLPKRPVIPIDCLAYGGGPLDQLPYREESRYN